MRKTITAHRQLRQESVVEQLYQQGYAVFDHFFSEEEVSWLRVYADGQRAVGVFKRAGVGRGEEHAIDDTIRGDEILWLDERVLPADGQFVVGYLRAFIQFVNRRCLMGVNDYEVHFAVYPSGTFYKRHLDTFRDSDARKLSVICYLNDPDWSATDGGQLMIYPEGQSAVEIVPLGGRMVCFESAVLEHEVLPAIRDRYSLTGWLKYSTLPFLTNL